MYRFIVEILSSAKILHAARRHNPGAGCRHSDFRLSWPDSIYRYHKVVEALVEDFHVVVPSIPGFGFSGRTTLILS